MTAGAENWELRAYILNHNQETEKTGDGRSPVLDLSNKVLSTKPPK